MLPEQIKKQVQEVFDTAKRSTSILQPPSNSGLAHLLREVRLYGREAGLDFIATHLRTIVQSAVGNAESKSPSLALALDAWGQAARESAAQALRELTALRVELAGSTLTIIWATSNGERV